MPLFELVEISRWKLSHPQFLAEKSIYDISLNSKMKCQNTDFSIFSGEVNHDENVKSLFFFIQKQLKLEFNFEINVFIHPQFPVMLKSENIEIYHCFLRNYSDSRILSSSKSKIKAYKDFLIYDG